MFLLSQTWTHNCQLSDPEMQRAAATAAFSVCAPNPCFKPSIFNRLESLTGDQPPVRILRDIGGSQSVILSGALPFSEQSMCGYGALLRGIDMGYMPRPVHHIHVHSKLITGFFPAAVCPALPVRSIAFLMGNDIAGGTVTPALEELDSPQRMESGNVQPHSDLFSACLATCEQSLEGNDVFVSDSVLMPDYGEHDLVKVPPNWCAPPVRTCHIFTAYLLL